MVPTMLMRNHSGSRERSRFTSLTVAPLVSRSLIKMVSTMLTLNHLSSRKRAHVTALRVAPILPRSLN